jgi:hypothetical protein
VTYEESGGFEVRFPDPLRVAKRIGEEIEEIEDRMRKTDSLMGCMGWGTNFRSLPLTVQYLSPYLFF